MFTELRSALRPAVVMLAGFTLLTGVAYPLLVTGIATVALPAQAGGSLVRDGNRVVGSALIGQDFTSPRYFHPRPSAAGKGYDASASSGSNLAPGSKDLADRIGTAIGALRDEGVAGAIPADMVTTSGSGLDPDISPDTARLQVARVAGARGLPAAAVATLVETQVQTPLLGLLGEPRVNVLALNRALDALARR
ncbi:potassium-transporting ATPase subunit KdpC [Polymorphobacter fuscus]|uniref:Potassium-transporting ATPase KdpC subunit n=1 Tax=Sandarakinorhabdus fusca TaxID=1439888 RepID=A0A7C9KMV1_9SPHN|nr:potassium-transporting ATPase subunit KdpC [Polymorphobacter fuscus]KAB7647908.1 potassium-transporting ATPase subunit KdpC [Polymorphobacter fuscus]MQT17224.1 potassium-transporting ATPase subunit KdpC [Polymorphobacter fuscus]NJC08782.1 K+-transporting ATPase ATPase C chain [Polymorphobacter fuscus]